jgi:hypothetical protein
LNALRSRVEPFKIFDDLIPARQFPVVAGRKAENVGGRGNFGLLREKRGGAKKN